MSENIYTIITKNGTKKHPYPLLYKKEDGLWRSKNQISSYELVSKLVDNIKNVYDYRLINSIDKTIYSDMDKYGYYANNNSWTPVFTEIQLQNFITLF